MEEPERRVLPQRKSDPDHFLERPYLDVCLSDEDELSDWSEEDLSLHFSASVLKSSGSESEPETGPGPESEPEPGTEPGPEPGPESVPGPAPGPQSEPGPEPRPETKTALVLAEAQPDRTGPQAQVQSPDPYLDLPKDKSCPQQERPRPHQLLRQHSLPEAGGGAYKGLIAGLQTPGGEVQDQRKLQKSFSLDESRTKMASCLIKNVLSKRMQGEDQQGALRPTQPKPRPQPAPHGSGFQSKPPSRGHIIKLAACLSQSQHRVEASQPTTGQRSSSQPITARIHPDQSNVHQSEHISRELQVPQPSCSAPDRSSSLGCSLPPDVPPWFSSRDLQATLFSPSGQQQASSKGHHQSAVDRLRPSQELQGKAPHSSPSAQDRSSSLGNRLPQDDPPSFTTKELQASLFSPSEQEQASSVGCLQSAVDPPRPSRDLQTKASHAPPPPPRKSSFVGSTQPRVDPVRLSSRELRDPMSTAQEKASSLPHTRPLQHRFSSSRKLQTRASHSSPSCQEQASALAQSHSDLDPPRLSPRELRAEACHSLGSQQSSSLRQHLKAVPPPWASSRDPLSCSSSSQEQRPSLGQRQLAVAPPWSRDAPRSSTQGQTSVCRIRPVAPWSSPSSELQAPLPSRSAQDETSLVGRARPALPWLSSVPGSKAMQRKALLDPETGQFVQVFVPVPSPTPLLHTAAPIFACPAPSMLGYAPLLPVTPNPTLLVQVQPTVFSQSCFMFPSIQPWVYYRPT